MKSQAIIEESQNFSPTAATEVPPATVARPADTPPAALFQGFDTFTSAGRATAVEGKSAPGAEASTYYKVCTTIDSLQSALDVSGSVSASFGFGTVDAKAQFIKSLSVTNTSVTIVVYTSVIASSLKQTDVWLKKDVPLKDLKVFCLAYGDSYLSEIVTGAEYAAAYVCYSESIEQKQDVLATLTASGISGNGSLDIDLQTKLATALSGISTGKSLKQFMSGIRNPDFPDASGIIDYALKFGKKTADAPAVIHYGVTGYEHVPGMPDTFASTVRPTRDLYNGIRSQEGLADSYARLQALKNSCAAIGKAYQIYGYKDEQLTSREKTIVADIKTLDILFHEMDGDPTRTYHAPTLDGLGFGTPSVNVLLKYVGPYGGPGGGPFHDVAEGSVGAACRLSKIEVRGGLWIDYLKPSYLFADGSEFSPKRGGDGGNNVSELILQKNERVTSVSGTYNTQHKGGADYVFSLTIGTSNGRQWSCPAKPDNANHSFSWTASDGAVFLGFEGRSGAFLDQVTIVTATLKPTQWEPLPSPPRHDA